MSLSVIKNILRCKTVVNLDLVIRSRIRTRNKAVSKRSLTGLKNWFGMWMTKFRTTNEKCRCCAKKKNSSKMCYHTRALRLERICRRKPSESKMNLLAILAHKNKKTWNCKIKSQRLSKKRRSCNKIWLVSSAALANWSCQLGEKVANSEQRWTIIETKSLKKRRSESYKQEIRGAQRKN